MQVEYKCKIGIYNIWTNQTGVPYNNEAVVSSVRKATHARKVNWLSFPNCLVFLTPSPPLSGMIKCIFFA